MGPRNLNHSEASTEIMMIHFIDSSETFLCLRLLPSSAFCSFPTTNSIFFCSIAQTMGSQPFEMNK